MKAADIIAELQSEKFDPEIWVFFDTGGEGDMRPLRVFPLAGATPAIGVAEATEPPDAETFDEAGQQPTTITEFMAALQGYDPEATVHVVDDEGVVQPELHFFYDWCGMISDALSALYISARSPKAEDGSWIGPSSRDHGYPDLGFGTYASPSPLWNAAVPKQD